jgi:erythritol kinase (D-erythritol 1-phosphate-forming)
MILGVDVGTSVTKAFLLGRDGCAVATHSVPSTVRRLPGGRVEQDLDEVVDTVVRVVRSVRGQAPEPIEALALTGQGDGLWLRDKEGIPVGPGISWLDARASDVLDRWYEGGPASVLGRVHKLTGSGMFPGSAGPLLAYLANNDPQRLERSAVAGYCVDAIVQRFTGEITVDASDASLPFLDVSSRTYSDDALALCGLSGYRGLLAEPAPPGKLFALDGRSAKMLDLPSGLPVSAGPFDLPACALGAGIREIGDGNLVIGTTLGCQVLRDEVRIDPAEEPSGMWLAIPSPTPHEDRYLKVMPAMVGTANLDWVLGMVGARVEELETLLNNSEPGAHGVSALSFLSGSGERAPFVEPRARGQFTGLSLDTTPADLVRAMCEAVSYAARHNLESAGLAGEVSACGGGARSAAWGQIFADVLGRPVHVPHEEGVGARGAAMTAWDSLGEPVDREQWAAARRTVRPHPRAVEFYEQGYRDYLSAIDLARPVWRRRAG